eukprot:9321152-Pyramimonas_sp.AAC.1
MYLVSLEVLDMLLVLVAAVVAVVAAGAGSSSVGARAGVVVNFAFAGNFQEVARGVVVELANVKIAFPQSL